MRVTWEPLTLVEARGIILSYTVSYTPTDRARQTLTVSADSEQDHVLIGDLDPSKGYTVLVWATTSAGDGDSNATSVEALPQTDSE